MRGWTTRPKFLATWRSAGEGNGRSARRLLSGRARSRASEELLELQQQKRQEALENGTLTVDRIDYDRPLSVVSYPDPRLRQPNAKIRLPAAGIEDLAKDMFDIMYRDDGIGLAAPQVGVNVQMMVFNPQGVEAKGDSEQEVVLINPRILRCSKGTSVCTEGCLSFYHPVKVEGHIERPAAVKIKALNLKGEKITLTLTELPARIFQHEFDHLRGTLFFERMSPEVLESVRHSLRRYEEEFAKDNSDVAFERLFS